MGIGGLMRIEDFKAGTYLNQYKYKSFHPTKINHMWIWNDPKINTLLAEANRLLGELNAYSMNIPEIDFFIEMHVVKEAQASSKIEGTKTEIDEIFLDKKIIAPEKRDDWQEVKNYIDAMNHGIKKLEKVPLSNRLLKEMHKLLLSGVRGKDKSPCNFRKSQNWIGGSNLNDAVYIPPHHSEIEDLMGDLELFLHNDKIEVPHLIKIAITHYQFETIHPFLDGNGRIGRLLITFYLVSNGLLKKPSLYISDFFEKNRASYYDALSRVRIANNLVHWIRFFLNGVIKTSVNGKNTFNQILSLRNKDEDKIISLKRRVSDAKMLLKFLYKVPIINAETAMKITGKSKKSVYNLIYDLERLKILKENSGKAKNRYWIYEEYFKIFMK